MAVTAQRPGWEELRVAAFNIQVFGLKKMKSKKIAQVLGQIIARYDIVLVQEVRDRSGKAIRNLQKLANSHAGEDSYGLTISKRLGRTASKEQYAFLYRQENVEVADVFQFDDTDIGDVFHRDPFCIKFKLKNAKSGSFLRNIIIAPIVFFLFFLVGLTEFAIIAIHTDPDKAKEETDNLTKVHEAVTKRWNINDVAIMGDFNADRYYVKGSDFVDIDLFTDKKFHWLISSEEDTTVTKTDAAYDRIVVTGEKLLAAIKQDTVGPFHFDEEYKLTEEEACHVSDHYPVEMTLQISERIELPQLHGQLVKTPSDLTKVWMINEYGHKVGVPQGTLKTVFKTSKDTIRTLPADLSPIREDNGLDPDALLAKGSDSNIYLISNGMKRMIADMKTLDYCHFNSKAAVTLPPVVLRSIPAGRPIQYPDPTLRRFRKRDRGMEKETPPTKSKQTRAMEQIVDS